jgi:eukaryotic-like serine/threonine-protein kinase
LSTLDRLTAALADRYRIERELGQGGMATVYLAHDLKHDRDVAIKVLLPELAAVIGAERFLTEIKTTANLQHPHILPLFDSGSADGQLFYVMPYVEGETLRGRLTRETQLPVADAVRLATEVAAALDYAHKRGVVHRDIKPENILVQSGSALVADFGIALAVQQAGASRMTQTGMSLGTPQYMSPEQAMGEKQIDARSDIYALGAITYEMLIGEPPFTGPSAQAIVAKVMTETPKELTAQRKSIPPGVAAAVEQALEKLPADRFATAADFAAALANPNPTMARTGMQPVATSSRRTWLVTAAVALVALAAGLAVGMRRGGGAVAESLTVASLRFGDSTVIRAVNNIRFAISPSGRRVVFNGPDGDGYQLWVRDLDQPTAHPLPDTRGGVAPFFSPDGESVGFFTGSAGAAAMKVIAISGGVARTVVQDSVTVFGGGSWGEDGQIYFTHSNRGLARVSSAGGAITKITHPDSSRGIVEHDYPDLIPGGRFAIIMMWKGSIAANHIGLVDLKSGAVTDLLAGSYARYIAPGFLAVGTSEGRIVAVRFDPQSGKLLGSPVAMLQDVQQESTNGTVQFAVSRTGTIVFEPRTGGNDGLAWVDRTGAKTAVDTALKGGIGEVSLSPDGSQIAMSRSLAGEAQIWVEQLKTGIKSRLSFDVTTADRPVWTRDGQRVAFLATRGNNLRVSWMRRADGSDSLQRASPGNTRLDEIAFDPLGRYIVLRSEGSGPGSRKLLVVEIGKDTIPRPLIVSKFDHYAAAISPDGKWLAYVSEESGSPEVYVRPFPNVDSARFAISVGGGNEPRWSPNGSELFFRNSRGAMLVAPITSGRQFDHGTPTVLFAVPGLTPVPYYHGYDVHPDGKRFLMVTSGGVDAPTLDVIFNWQVELNKIKGGSQ